jgi:AraC-like DNA-binding protein
MLSSRTKPLISSSWNRASHHESPASLGMNSAIRYQSEGLCIRDASWPSEEAQSGRGTLALEAGSIALVRSGALQAGGSDAAIVDANHFLLATRAAILMPYGGQDGACTIFRFEPTAFDKTPVIECGIAASLSTPAVFLRHWHLLCWTRTRADDIRLIERAASGLLEEFALAAPGDWSTGEHVRLVKTIEMALTENGAMPVSLERLAANLRMSQFTISRTFHRTVGITIRHYCKRLRLRKALQMMLDSDADLSSIAMDLGFFDQAHFSNAFRQDFGVSPSLILAAHRRGRSKLTAL